MIRKSPHPPAGPALQSQEPRITLSQQLSASLRHLKQRITLLPEPYACCMLFFTVAAQGSPDGVFFVRRTTLEAAWREGSTRVRQWAWMRQLAAVELRIDWPDEILVIGNRLPGLLAWGAASAWALADDDLEHAELLPPAALPGASHAATGGQGGTDACAPPLRGLAEVNLLLRLQGLHVDRNGLQTPLPTAPALQRPPASPPPRPPAPLHLQPDQRRHGAGCDRRCVPEALLLAQRQAANPALALAEMLEAIERALACLEQHMHGRQVPPDPADVEQAMGLLVFTRHIAGRNADVPLAALLSRMERLTTHLAVYAKGEISGTRT